MTRWVLGLSVVALTVPVGAAEKADGCFGTRVAFFDTPKEAAARAARDEKLVFVLHVSGNFEDPRET
jgi:hypothetical protein